MKSYSHLYEKIYDPDNLRLAIHRAAKGAKKKRRRDVQYCLSHEEDVVQKLHDMLVNETYVFKQHEPRLRYDQNSHKYRKIIAPTYYYEQIIHHAIIQVLQPIFMKGMYEYSCGSIPKRGASYGKRYLERWIQNNPKKRKYVLKMDIHHYFDSVDHDVIKAKIRRKFHDERLNRLLFAIIDGHEDSPGRGIPIGYYTSQWISNWILQDMDHMIKEELKAPCYVRYMDDMVIIGPNKRELHRMKDAIETYLQEKMHLGLKGNWQVYRFDYIKRDGKRIGRDIDFMGFRFFSDRTIMRKRALKKCRRKATKIYKEGKKPNAYESMQMISHMAELKATDTYDYYKRFIKEKVNVRGMRHTISRWSKRRNQDGTKVEQIREHGTSK